jgi:hypothetical protein
MVSSNGHLLVEDAHPVEEPEGEHEDEEEDGQRGPGGWIIYFFLFDNIRSRPWRVDNFWLFMYNMSSPLGV